MTASTHPLDSVERAIADIAAGKAGRGGRRRGAGERGRHHLRGRQGDAGADGVHDPAQQRGDLRPDAGRDARPARDPADDAAQPRPDADGVHDLGGRPRRRLAPGSAPRTARTPRGCWPTRPPSPGSSRGPGTCSRCATARAACSVRRGHTEAAVDLARLAGLTPVGVLVEIVNDDGTMKRSPELRDVRRRARPGDDLDRRPGPLPPPHRGPGRAGRRDPVADPARRLHGVRLPLDRSTAPSTSPWCTATSAATSRC